MNLTMKNLLLLALLLSCFNCFSQSVNQYLGSPNTVIVQKGYQINSKGLGIGKDTTNDLPTAWKTEPLISLLNDSLYVWSFSQNKWITPAAPYQNIYTNNGTIAGDYRHVNLGSAQLTYDTKQVTPPDWDTPSDSLSVMFSLADTTDDDLNIKMKLAYYEAGQIPQVHKINFTSYQLQESIEEAGANWGLQSSAVQTSEYRRDTTDGQRFLSNRYQSYSANSISNDVNDSVHAEFFTNAGGYEPGSSIAQVWVTNNQFNPNSGNKVTFRKDSTTFSKPLKINLSLDNSEIGNYLNVSNNDVWATSGDTVKITGVTGYYSDWDDYGQNLAVSYYSGGSFVRSVERIHDMNAFELEYKESLTGNTGTHSTYNFASSVDFMTLLNGAEKAVFELSTSTFGASVFGATTSTNGSMQIQQDRASLGMNASGTTASIGVLSFNPYINVPSTNNITFKNSTSNTVFATFTPTLSTFDNPVEATFLRITTQATPTNPTESLPTGTIKYDDNYIYVRTSTAWKKVPLTAL